MTLDTGYTHIQLLVILDLCISLNPIIPGGRGGVESVTPDVKILSNTKNNGDKNAKFEPP